MSDLTKDTLPSPDSRRPLVPVDLPAWGGTLYVRTISVADAKDLPEDAEAFLAALLLRTVVYADGSQVWTEDAEALAYPMADLKPLMTAALDANGLSEKAVEDAKGN